MAGSSSDDDGHFDFDFDEKDEPVGGNYYEEDEDAPDDEVLYSKSFVTAFFSFKSFGDIILLVLGSILRNIIIITLLALFL